MDSTKNLGRFFFVAFLIILIPQILAATVYYIDATNGNNNNAGTSQAQAWKTIAKVNNFPFSAGDKFFSSGEIPGENNLQ